MSTLKHYLSTLYASIKAHKIIGVIVLVAILGGGYWEYGKLTSTSGETRYVLGTVTKSTIISVVSASGQVSPSNQVTINPKASGTVTKVIVKEGQTLAAGQPIAYLDSTDEYNTVQSAQTSLKNAQLSLQKLQQPADQLSVTQSQNAIAKAQESEQTARTNLTKAYADSYNDVAATYFDLLPVMIGLKDIVLGTEAANGSQWNIDYYSNTTQHWDDSVRTYRDNAYNAYNTAVTSYNSALTDYQKTNQSSSTSTIDAITKETSATAQSVSTALGSANSFIQFYEDLLKNNNQTPNSEADTSLTNLNTYISKINPHLSTLRADQNSITSDVQAIADAQRTIAEDQLSLQKLQAGANTLDVQSSQLSVQQQQNALAQAQANLGNYTVRAPIAGTLAVLNLHVGDTVGSGTNGATEITRQQIADLSLNEVDAAKVTAGQKVTLTFDAIPDLTLTGTVTNVSPLGTVTQGVVSYGVKIATDTQDPRVKAGMTVNASIQSAVHQDVLSVPSSAIKTMSGQSSVQVFNPPLADTGGTSGVTSKTSPASVPVTLGISDDTNTEILSGLTEGQQIVIRTTSSTAKTTAATATSRTGGGGFGGGGGGGALRGL